MKKMLLSIIVPIYNIESYIKPCIDSLLNQDIEDYEVICVNDGSTDQSLEVLKSYHDSKLRIINQENRGLSGARNAGLRAAVGEYVLFIDGDDFLRPKSLKKLLNIININNLDALSYNFIDYYLREKYKIANRDIVENKVMNGLDFYKEMYGSDKRSCPMSWLYIYKRNFLLDNNLYFCEGIIHEDVEFLIRFIRKVNRIMYVNDPIYYYRKRENSIMTTIKANPVKISSYFKIIETYSNERMLESDTFMKRLIEKREFRTAMAIIDEYNTHMCRKMSTEEKVILRNIIKKNGTKKAKLFTLTKLTFNFYIFLKQLKS